MNRDEQDAWVNLKITSKTFQKTEQEKIALANAKAKHKQFIKDNPNHGGLK